MMGRILLFVLLAFCGVNSKVSFGGETINWRGIDIDELTQTDTVVFKQLIDTLTFYAGRDANKALGIALQMEKVIFEFDNPYFRKTLDIHLGQLNLLTGNPDRSSFYIKRGIEEASVENDTLSLMSFYYLQGWLCSNQKKSDLEMDAYVKGLELANKSKNFERQMAFLSSLSIIDGHGLSSEKKLHYLRKAKKIGEVHDLKTDDTYQSVLYNMAGQLQIMGRIDTAIVIYNELRAIYNANNYTSGLASLSSNELHIYLERKEYEKALNKGFEALKYDKLTGTDMYIISDFSAIAKVYEAMGEIDNAIAFYLRADSLSMVSGMLNKRLEITQSISTLYKQKGDFEKSLFYLENNIESRDSFNIIETSKKVKELENKYLTSQDVYENELLKVKSERNKRTIMIQIVFLFLLILMVLIISIQLVFNFKSRKKVEYLNAVLRRKNLDLERTNKTKDRFLSIISHDLRGPIGTLTELLNVIDDNWSKLPEKEILYLLNTTKQEANRSFTLIENLLLWAKSQFQDDQAVFKEVLINDLVNDTLQSVIGIAKNKEVKIDVHFNDDDLVYTDKEMLAFIVRNITSNAIKFTPNGGNITLFGKTEDNKFMLSVKDNGVGMEEMQIQNLFKFRKNSWTQGTNNESGTGLGLILSKDFANMINAKITISSTIKKGTTFIIELPTTKHSLGA